MKTILLYFITLFFLFLNLTSQTWERFTTENSDLPKNLIKDILIDAEDNLWLLNDSSISQYSSVNKNWKIYNNKNSLIGSKLSSFCKDKNDNIWVAGDGIYQFEKKTNKWLKISDYKSIQEIAVGNNGTIYISSLTQVFKFSNNSWENIFSSKDNSSAYPVGLKIDTFNNLWFGTQGFPNGVYSFKNNNLKVYNEQNYKIPNFYTTGLAIDSLNNLWFLTERDLITYKYIAAQDRWIKYDSTNSILGKRNYNFSKNIEVYNKVWFTSSRSGGFKPRRLISFDYENWSEYNIDIALNIEDENLFTLNALAIDSKNNIWIGTDKGLIKFNEAQTTVATFEQSNINLYPNPTSEFMKIDLHDNLVSSYSILDLNGKIVKQQHHNFQNQITIDIKQLIAGTYFIKLKLSDNTYVQSKFVKE